MFLFLEVAKRQPRMSDTFPPRVSKFDFVRARKEEKYKKDYRHTREPRNESTKFPDKFFPFSFYRATSVCKRV